MLTATERIVAYNTERQKLSPPSEQDSALIAKKYAALRESPFRFFRGTAHLFYEDYALERPSFLDSTALAATPVTWVSGDLHGENFGSYKGNNRLVYFDVNDFDEAVLAPCTVELVRLLTSLHLACEAFALPKSDLATLLNLCVNGYADALRYGKAKYVERENAHGIVADLLESVRDKKRRDFLDKRTTKATEKSQEKSKEKSKEKSEKKSKEKSKKKSTRISKQASAPHASTQRRFILDDRRYAAASPAEHKIVRAFVEDFAASDFAHRHASPEVADEQRRFFQAMDFRVLDVAHRIAGTGSLGVSRFAVLLEGMGSPNKNYILDIKQSVPSAALPLVNALGIEQPRWRHEAERTAEVQRRMQAASPAFLHHAVMKMTNRTNVKSAARGAKTSVFEVPYLIRELQPTQDKIALAEQWQGNFARLESFVLAAARLAAWGQLRSAGRQGSAIADELIDFGARLSANSGSANSSTRLDMSTKAQGWRKHILEASTDYAQRVRKDWSAFCKDTESAETTNKAAAQSKRKHNKRK
jgi:uncharacterized protein (DUF2252 family)